LLSSSLSLFRCPVFRRGCKGKSFNHSTKTFRNF
jgi:hypothetical protein